jgi:hypothetical protein
MTIPEQADHATRLRDIKAFSGDVESDRVIAVRFNRKVDDADRAALLAAINSIIAPKVAQPLVGVQQTGFQKRVLEWMMACFSMEICRDGMERNHRFLEEALELVQSLGSI